MDANKINAVTHIIFVLDGSGRMVKKERVSLSELFWGLVFLEQSSRDALGRFIRALQDIVGSLRSGGECSCVGEWLILRFIQDKGLGAIMCNDWCSCWDIGEKHLVRECGRCDISLALKRGEKMAILPCTIESGRYCTRVFVLPENDNCQKSHRATNGEKCLNVLAFKDRIIRAYETTMHNYCKYCGHKTTSVNSLTASLCQRHPNGPGKGHHALYEGGEKTSYVCKYCGLKSTSIASLTSSKCQRHPDGASV